MKLYATIHPASKYAHQCSGEPFPVQFAQDATNGYIWAGGPGRLYRHSDLDLLQLDTETNQFRNIPMYASGEETNVVNIILAEYMERAKEGDLPADWMCNWVEEVNGKLQKIAAKAIETDTEVR